MTDIASFSRRPAVITAERGEHSKDTLWYVVEDKDPDEEKQSLRAPLIATFVAIAVGFGGFLTWGFTASLDSAAIATGNVIVDSQRKTVSHLEGGILKRLLVREGDLVKKGQPLLELDNTRARAELEQLIGRRIGLLGKIARLQAEQALADEITFPAELTESPSPIAADVIAAEQRLFAKRRAVYEGRIAYQKKEVEQYSEQIKALTAQIDAGAQRKVLLQDRVDALRGLHEKGYASKATLAEVELELSEVTGDSGEYFAERARAEQARQAAEMAILSTEEEWQSEIAGEILQARLDLNETNERIVAARDVLQRLEVVSPQDGVVIAIQTRTPGSAIEPGRPIMDIVPRENKMLVEARMNLRDIDAVRVGSETQVRLTAYDYRSTRPVPGKVTLVDADQTVNPQTQDAYYLVRAEVDPEALAERPEIVLYPGMPAELLILRRPRKAIDYLLEPITESFTHAFRED